MSESRSRGFIETIAGAIVLILACIFLIYSFQKSGISRQLYNEEFMLTAEFNSVDGLSIGSNIFLAGVKIGTVSDIQLNLDNFLARVTISLYDDFAIPDDTEAIIVSDGLLGEKYISLNPGGSSESLNTGDQIIYTQSAVNIVNLLNKFSGK